jgi:gliding motility-associated-like protein/uncharacterized repeat protein (TIGR01451 family)
MLALKRHLFAILLIFGVFGNLFSVYALVTSKREAFGDPLTIETQDSFDFFSLDFKDAANSDFYSLISNGYLDFFNPGLELYSKRGTHNYSIQTVAPFYLEGNLSYKRNPVENQYFIDNLDCSLNSYAISVGEFAQFEILVSYSGGEEGFYEASKPIDLGNGDLTAILEAGNINPAGGFLVYTIKGTPSSTDPIRVPVNFGGKSCEVDILVRESSFTLFNFSIIGFLDEDFNCVKDGNESEIDFPSDALFIKVFDRDDKMVYKNSISSGQFEVQDFEGLTEEIYYYIIDTNDFEDDKEPSLPVGWISAMDSPLLKRYFYYDGNVYLFNKSLENNLLDASWDSSFPFFICFTKEEGKIASLDCTNLEFSEPFTKDVPYSGFLNINYTGGNKGLYEPQELESEGVLGIKAVLEKDTFEEGNGILTFSLSGVPLNGGVGFFSIQIGGQKCQAKFVVKETEPDFNLLMESIQSSFSNVGDTIQFLFVVQNVGEVSLVDVIIEDVLTDFNTKIPKMIPGEEITLKTNFRVEQVHLDLGQITDEASATIQFGGESIQKLGSKTIFATQNPKILISGESKNNNFQVLDEKIHFTIHVKNIGNVTLNNLLIEDSLTGFSSVISSLAPQMTQSFSTEYQVIQKDLDKGKVVNSVNSSFVFGGGNYKFLDSLTVNYVPFTPTILVREDDFVRNPINILENRNAGNVLLNDTLHGLPVKAQNVEIFVVENGGLVDIRIDPNGDLILPEGTPSGTYLIRYKLCELGQPLNCAENSIIVKVFRGVHLRILDGFNSFNLYEGDQFEYLIKIENNGKSLASKVKAKIDLPDGLMFISSNSIQRNIVAHVNNGEIKWEIGELEKGDYVDLHLKLKAVPLLDGVTKSFQQTVSVFSAEFELSQNDNSKSYDVVVKPFFIPNIITPNGDGINDRFEIKGFGRFVSVELRIFNRLGDLVFNQMNYDNAWSAEGLSEGIYFYVLDAFDAEGKLTEFKGWVQILSK